MGQKLRRRATIEEIKEAMDSLQQQGQKATADKILAEIIHRSNGTVGSSKGTILRLRQQLKSTDNGLVSVAVGFTQSKPNGSDKTQLGLLNSLDKTQLSTLKSELEVQLWAKLEARLEAQLHQISKNNSAVPVEALQTENLALQEQVERLKAVVEEIQSENEVLRQQIQQEAQKALETQIEPLNALVETLQSENEALHQQLTELQERPQQQAQPTELPEALEPNLVQLLAAYRTQIQQKRTELEGKKLESPRWEKLAQFVLELEEIEIKINSSREKIGMEKEENQPTIND